MLTHSHSRSSRAALMATLTKITVVVFQLALAVALFRKAEGAVERPSVPCIATVRGEGGIGVGDATAARGDPKWLALVRVPLPPLLLPTPEGTACS
jgi:hypothetical protein